mmetsp:Transcript_42656/g.134331  ORF Transcript_42656/g.134331 Transcript_42656/m.134331 type:complete len:154 (-) Transcript_42656:203-664(-)
MDGSTSTLTCPRLDMLFLKKERRDESLYKLSLLSSSLLARHLPSFLAACCQPYPSIHGIFMLEVCSEMRLCHPLALDLLDDLLSHIIDDPARQPAHAEIIRGDLSLPALRVEEKEDVSQKIQRCSKVLGQIDACRALCPVTFSVLQERYTRTI